MSSAELYREAFVLDCNALEPIGVQFDDTGRFQALRDSGISVLKTTLGGANGSIAPAVASTLGSWWHPVIPHSRPTRTAGSLRYVVIPGPSPASSAMEPGIH